MASSTVRIAPPGEPLRPNELGGHGQGRTSLLGNVYDSTCPPATPLNSILIAVCGPNDFKNNAQPQNDGFFFSDFYLYHHMFRGAAGKQYWLTCVKPETYVKKYTELLHGHPTDERRIVLNAAISERKETSDIITVEPSKLGSRFLEYVANASRETKNTDKQVFVMMFGHGDEFNYGVTVGGAGEFDDCPKIKASRVKQALRRHNPEPHAAILLISCYGGGRTMLTDQNLTAMAGVDQTQELLSRPCSGTVGRYCGTRWTSGVVQALIRT